MAKKQHIVTRADARRSLLEWLHQHLGLPWQQARQLVREGRVPLDDRPCLDAARRLQRGQRIAVDVAPPSRRREARPPTKQRAGGPALRHADAQVVVVDKPAGLTTVRHADEAAAFGKRGRHYLPPTLADLL